MLFFVYSLILTMSGQVFYWSMISILVALAMDRLILLLTNIYWDEDSMYLDLSLIYINSQQQSRLGTPIVISLVMENIFLCPG